MLLHFTLSSLIVYLPINNQVKPWLTALIRAPVLFVEKKEIEPSLDDRRQLQAANQMIYLHVKERLKAVLHGGTGVCSDGSSGSGSSEKFEGHREGGSGMGVDRSVGVGGGGSELDKRRRYPSSVPGFFGSTTASNRSKRFQQSLGSKAVTTNHKPGPTGLGNPSTLAGRVGSGPGIPRICAVAVLALSSNSEYIFAGRVTLYPLCSDVCLDILNSK